MRYPGRVRALAAAAVLLAGCNGLLGLDDVERARNDMDADGIEDSLDNCPFVANPEQADADADHQGDACDSCPTSRPTRDRDNDGIDDACDPCPIGGPHDEDLDGFVDACDACPGVPNADQSDGDADGVGDACDPATGEVNERAVFDGFAPPRAQWASPDPWMPTEDGERIAAVGSVTTAMVDSTQDLDGLYPTVAAHVAFDAVTPGLELGVGVRATEGDVLCLLRCTPPNCRLTLIDETGTKSIGMVDVTAGSGRIALTLGTDRVGRTIGLCSFHGLADDEVGNRAAALSDVHPMLLGQTGVSFQDVDVIR